MNTSDLQDLDVCPMSVVYDILRIYIREFKVCVYANEILLHTAKSRVEL